MAAGRGEVFEATLQGKALVFPLDNCELFLVDASGEKPTKTKICRAVHVENRAIGNGNRSGGTYRALDGVA